MGLDLGVTIVTAIAAIWALGLLSLAFTLPAEFILPADPEVGGKEKLRIARELGKVSRGARRKDSSSW
jgi:hypothetical protein